MSDIEDRLRAALHDETAELSARPELADDMVSHGMSVRRRRRAAGGIASIAVLAAVFPVWKAIDTTSGPIPPSDSLTPTVISQSTLTTPTTPTTPPQTTSTTPQVWPSAPVDAIHVLRRPTHVVNLRVATHDTYDRVVIDFDGKLPSYHIRYVPALTYDGSGAPVALDGQRYIQISLTLATGHDDQGNSLYLGEDLTPYAFPTLLGTAYTGDLDGVVSFGLAVSRHAGFMVSTQPGPNRLIIDLQH